MYYAEIVKAVERLKRRYHETDPFQLCVAMGIILIPQSLGTAQDAIKGFYLESKSQKFIVAHELGHAELHRKLGMFAFNEVGLFDESSRQEKDANLFAAELLLDDDEVLQTLNEDNTFFSAAASLEIPMELLDFKFRVMKWKGYKLVEPPIIARSNFLKDLEIPENNDYDW